MSKKHELVVIDNDGHTQPQVCERLGQSTVYLLFKNSELVFLFSL